MNKREIKSGLLKLGFTPLQVLLIAYTGLIPDVLSFYTIIGAKFPPDMVRGLDNIVLDCNHCQIRLLVYSHSVKVLSKRFTAKDHYIAHGDCGYEEW